MNETYTLSSSLAPESWAEHAARTTVLRGTVGSTAHGLALDGTDDRDEMAVCVPGPEWVLGLSAPSHWVHRTAPAGERSRPGDLDLTIFTLRRYVYLLLRKANPTCHILLWVPCEQLSVCEPIGEELRARRRRFVCQQLGRSFLGYMTHQLQRLKGERGQKRCKRPELVERYGYDTKYAGHVVRLGFQGIEMASCARLTLPMPEVQRAEVLAVRRGERSLASVLALAAALNIELEGLISGMPETPDATLEKWLVRVYLERWALRE